VTGLRAESARRGRGRLVGGGHHVAASPGRADRLAAVAAKLGHHAHAVECDVTADADVRGHDQTVRGIGGADHAGW